MPWEILRFALALYEFLQYKKAKVAKSNKGIRLPVLVSKSR